MEPETRLKLNILMDSSIIDSSELQLLDDIDEMLHKSIHGEVNDEMLLIHIATMFDRLKKGNIIDSMPEEVWQQIISKSEIDQAQGLFNSVKLFFKMGIPESERQYIVMHLLTIVREKKND